MSGASILAQSGGEGISTESALTGRLGSWGRLAEPGGGAAASRVPERSEGGRVGGGEVSVGEGSVLRVEFVLGVRDALCSGGCCAVAGYRDDQGEMEGVGEWPLRNFLPPPEKLVHLLETVKDRLALSRASVDFFRGRAGEGYLTGAGSGRWSTGTPSGIGRARMRSRWHASTFLTAADRSYNPH